ncbi:hypothetical protein EON63_20470 [archaeon]|nr:MAG: hypothetical protein EON63_20470 [archaeon]
MTVFTAVAKGLVGGGRVARAGLSGGELNGLDMLTRLTGSFSRGFDHIYIDEVATSSCARMASTAG